MKIVATIEIKSKAGNWLMGERLSQDGQHRQQNILVPRDFAEDFVAEIERLNDRDCRLASLEN